GSQDFLMGNYPEFFVSNAADYLELTEKLKEGRPLSYFLGLNPLQWRLRAMKNMALSMLAPVRSPLAIQYWSQTPRLVGQVAVKFSLRPRGFNGSAAADRSSRDFLRETMSAHLRRNSAVFDLLAQIQVNAGTMPLEDPTVRWDESRSPYAKVASLR